MSDEMNVRKINDLDVVDAIPAGSSLLINDDGTAKLLKADVLEKAMPYVVKLTVDYTNRTATCDTPYATLKQLLTDITRMIVVDMPYFEPEVGASAPGDSEIIYINYSSGYAYYTEVHGYIVEDSKLARIEVLGEYIIFKRTGGPADIPIFYTPDGTLSFDIPEFDLPTSD